MTTPTPPSVDVWFPLMVRDWLTGAATFTMSNEQRGMFLQLLCHAWIQEPACTLPDDPALLAKYADCSLERWQEVGGPVLAQFRPIGNGRLANAKQLEVFQDSIQRRKKAQERATTAANARWNREHGGNAPSNAPSNAPGMLTECPSPSPSPSPSTDSATQPTTTTDFAEVLGQLPRLSEFADASAENHAALVEYAGRVVRQFGAVKLWAFLAVPNAALEGLDGPERTHDEVRVALNDHAAVDGQLSPKAVRAFLDGARRPTPPPAGGLQAGRSRGPYSPRRPAENRATADTSPNPLAIVGEGF